MERQTLKDAIHAAGYKADAFLASVEAGVRNRMRRGKPARKIRYYFYCSWAALLMRAEVGPNDPEYMFPPSVLGFLRAICPGDIKGEFRDEAYAVSMEEFCNVLGMEGQ